MHAQYLCEQIFLFMQDDTVESRAGDKLLALLIPLYLYGEILVFYFESTM